MYSDVRVETSFFSYHSHTRRASETSKTRKINKKMNNEVYAAIAMALHDDLGYNLHDSESGRLTIVARDSEWSSKAAKMTAKV